MKAGLYHPALAIALTVPDVCGKIYCRGRNKTGKKDTQNGTTNMF